MTKQVNISEEDVIKHQEKFAQRLFDDRHAEDSTCDLILISQDKQFRVHKSVLMTSSIYFRAMLTVEMKEKYAHQINIDHIPSERFAKIIDYIYTGRIYIDEECMYDVFEDAEYFQLEDLKLICINFFKSIMSPGNCLKLKLFAQKYHLGEITKHCEQTTNAHFKQIMQSDDFLCLKYDDVVDFIKQKNNVVNIEEEAFTRILEWIKHDLDQREEFFENLFLMIDLSSVSTGFLSEVAKQDVVTTRLTCLKRLVEAYASATTYSDTGKFLLIGGDSSMTDCMKYDVVTGQGKQMPKLNVGRCCAASVKFKRKVYVIGGAESRKGLNTFKSCEFLPLKEPHRWNAVPDMLEARTYCGAVYADGCIYITGGFNNGAMESCEKFELRSRRWEKIANMTQARYGHGSVVYEGAVCCVGGSGGTSNKRMTACVCYNICKNQWDELAHLNQGRLYAPCVVLEDCIYAIGGLDADGADMATVERYDSKHSKWELITPLLYARYGHSACVIGNKIYVIGGSNVKAVEVYDPKTNTWSECFETAETIKFAAAEAV